MQPKVNAALKGIMPILSYPVQIQETRLNTVLELIRYWRAHEEVGQHVWWIVYVDESGDSHTYSRFADLVLKATQLALDWDRQELERVAELSAAAACLHERLGDRPMLEAQLSLILNLPNFLGLVQEVAWGELDPAYQAIVAKRVTAATGAPVTPANAA